MDVAVVGAGPAGLAAAWALAAAGASVTIYERREGPGGRLRTDVVDGVRVDSTVQLLGSYYTETFRLAREVGAADLLVRSPGVDALWRRGRPHLLTYGSVASMIASGALPAGLKLRLGTKYLPFLTRHAGSLDASEPARAAEAGLDRESIAAWGRRELGEDFVELLAYPLLAAYYGSVPEAASAGFYHALARAGLDVSVYAVRGGVGELGRAVLAAVEARGGRFVGGVEVERIAAAGAGAEVRVDGSAARHDAAVVALPPTVAARVAELPEDAARWLGAVRATPGASVALVLDRPLRAGFFGLSFPRTEPPGDRLVALCVEERKGPGLVPPGQGLLVAYPAPALVPRLLDLDPAACVDLLLSSLETVFPGLRRHVVRARVYRHEEGVGEFYPGYLEHLGRYDPGMLPSSLALAGSYLAAPNVEGAVRSGRAAASRVLGRR